MTVFIYGWQDYPRWSANAMQMGWATWEIWEAKTKCSFIVIACKKTQFKYFISYILAWYKYDCNLPKKKVIPK